MDRAGELSTKWAEVETLAGKRMLKRRRVPQRVKEIRERLPKNNRLSPIVVMCFFSDALVHFSGE
jgi:hypothetical protein